LIKHVFNKLAKALKIPISTIRAIIKKFQTTQDVTNLAGRVWGEFEGLKTQTALYHHMLFRRVSRQEKSSKNKPKHFQWSDTTGSLNGLDSVIRW